MNKTPLGPVMPPAAAAERFWDRAAEGYDAAHDQHRSTRSPLWVRIGVVLRLLGSRPGDVVDCGMGPGRLLVELGKRGWSVSGIDVSGEMVALARKRLPERSQQLLQGTMESLPFPPESFDAAVATGVLEYVGDLPCALAEVARVLRAGGRFVLSTPNTRSPSTFWRHRVVYGVVRTAKGRFRAGGPVPLPRPGLVSRRHLEKLLAAAGLEVVGTEYIVVAPRPLRALLPPVAARLESAGSRMGSLLGGQLVVAARKPASFRATGTRTIEEVRAP